MSRAEVVVSEPVLKMATIEGKVAGIVSLDPFTVQCYDCQRTASTTGDNPAWRLVVLEGWQFHVCEGRSGKRRCPDCLAAVIVACPSGRCKR